MKKRILTVLITIITVIPLVLSVPKADAQTSTHTTTSYGDYTFQQGLSTTTFDYELTPLAINLTWNSGSWMKLDYNFKDKYSGSIKFTVTSNQDWTLNSSPVYYSVYADGVESTAYISATTAGTAVGKTKTFSVIFTNATGIHFNVATGSSATFFTSSNSITISNFSVTSQPDLGDIYTDIHQIRLWWDLYIPGMSTNLSNIASNTSTIASDIAILKSYLDGLEGYVDNIEPYLNDLININKIQSRPLYQQSALLWALSYSDLNYDNLFPSFVYSTSNNDSAYTAINRLCVAPKSTYSLYIYTINTLGANSWNIYMRGSDTPITSTRTYAFTPPSTQYYLYRFDFTNNASSHVYFEIEFLNNVTIMPLFYGNKNNVPDDIHYLFGDELNNTYTRLLQSINTGISTLNGDYDTSQYDQYEQTIDGLNDSMRDRFNSSETSFQNNLNNILTPDQTSGGSNTIFEQFHFSTINGLFTGFLGQLFNAAPVLQYLLLFGLLLLVLGVFI